MRSSLVLLLFGCLIAILHPGCGGAETPEAVKQDADKAFQSKNHEKALELYSRLLDWKGEGTPSDADCFESALNIVRCKILQKDFEGAMGSLASMENRFSGTLKVKDYGTVIRAFVDQKAIDPSIAVIEKVGKLYPEKKEELAPFIEKIKAEGATPEQLQKLKDLGYL